MSMMDAMNQAAAPQQPQQMAPHQPQQAGPVADKRFMMTDGKPEEMQELYDKLMLLVSEDLWSRGTARPIGEQLQQDTDGDVSDTIGKFVAMYMNMCVAAAAQKGGDIPPIIMVAVAGETSAQLTDLALWLHAVEPGDIANDTADAGALIGIQIFTEYAKTTLAPELRQEYIDIAKAVINASPTAVDMAEEGAEDAIEDFEEEGGNLLSPEEVEDQEAVDMMTRPPAGGMAGGMQQAAM